MARGYVKYWEVETPEVISNVRNEIRFFNGHGKVQVFPKFSGKVGRGATLDVTSFSAEVLQDLFNELQMVNNLIREGGEQKANPTYWDFEKPTVFKSDKNEVRIYVEHGKFQVFPLLAVDKVGRGGTIDLLSMDFEELDAFESLLMKVFKLEEATSTATENVESKVDTEVIEIAEEDEFGDDPIEEENEPIEEKADPVVEVKNTVFEDTDPFANGYYDKDLVLEYFVRTKLNPNGLDSLKSQSKTFKLQELVNYFKMNYGKSFAGGSLTFIHGFYQCRVKGVDIDIKVDGGTLKYTWTEVCKQFIKENNLGHLVAKPGRRTKTA